MLNKIKKKYKDIKEDWLWYRHGLPKLVENNNKYNFIYLKKHPLSKHLNIEYNGLIDNCILNGFLLSEIWFDYVGSFKDNYRAAIVKLDNKLNLLTIFGKLVSYNWFDFIEHDKESFSNKLYFVTSNRIGTVKMSWDGYPLSIRSGRMFCPDAHKEYKLWCEFINGITNSNYCVTETNTNLNYLN